MSKGKGKEKATEPDWKEQVAMLDRQFGWDDEADSDWANSCDAEQQKLTDNGNENAFQIPSCTLEYDNIISPEMQRRIWDAAVEESKSSKRAHDSGPCEGASTHAIFDDSQEQDGAAQQQQMEDDEGWETAQEEHDEVDDEQEVIEPKSELAAYIYHRFGTGEIRYENRCECCDYLVDHAEERNKRKRKRFARAGGTSLIKDPCALLPYKQDDLPGTEDVDKPVLMVTTPEGETLYPHDLEEYPEPLAASRIESQIEMEQPMTIRLRRQSEYLVPYEEEDGPDI
ncbi:hypothetical protein F5883DRAFT_513919 [Diaporthe sp. PMI_573]|nr:hypothetical protein F5883DRAFT_513919 [Diaporthaceae sp. PMI_573]